MARQKLVLRLAALALTLSAGVGCAAGEAERREEARRARDERHSHIQQAVDSEDESSTEMTVKGDEGTLNAQDVELALQEHLGELRDCFSLGKAARGGGGRVMLRFFVDAKGEVDEVSVIESTLRNGPVERCLADIGVGVVFHPPSGRKPTTFDYPVEFRSGRPVVAGRQRRP